MKGAAIAVGARVELLNAVGDRLMATSDKHGAFAFENVPPSLYFVTATQAEFVGVVETAIAVPAGGEVRDVFVRLEQGRRVSGRFSGPDGVIAHGRVRVYARTPFARVIAMADAGPDGSFVVGPIRKGRYALLCQPVDGTAAEQVVLVHADKDAVANCVLPTRTTVRGTVIGDQGPVPGAAIRCHRQASKSGTPVHTVTSGADGSFELPSLDGGMWTITASSVGSLEGTTVVNGAKPGNPVVRLKPALAIEACVTSDGAAAVGAIVVLAQAAQYAEFVDERGCVRFNGLEAGTARVSAMRSSSSMLINPPGKNAYRNVTLEPGYPLQRVTLQLGLDRLLDGVVVDQDHQPVADARVFAISSGAGMAMNIAQIEALGIPSTATDAAGSFSIRAPEGPVVLLAHHGDDGEGRVPVPIDRTAGVVVQIRRGAGLSGIVVACDTGAALAAATVSVSRVSGFVAEQTVSAGSDGRFTLTSLREGSYVVSATSEQGVGQSEATVAPDAAKINVDVCIRKGVRLAGRVVDRSTALPVSGVQITPVGWSDRSVTTADDGRFVIDSFPRTRRAQLFMSGILRGVSTTLQDVSIDGAGDAVDLGDLFVNRSHLSERAR